MSAIRVGFIGLASNDASWSTYAHIPYLRQTQKYKIVALLSSSKESAEKAVQFNDLPAATAAYGDPASFAKDPNIDLVVCVVRVDRHFALIKPSIEAGKDCFVEWPVGSNLQEAEEMAVLAQKHGVKTFVGLQGRFSGIYNTVKRVIQEGRIGNLMSTHFVGAAMEGGAKQKEMYSYFYDKKVGGNILNIHVGHNLDNITWVLGEIGSFDALLSIAQPKGEIVDSAGKIIKTATRDTPDQIMLQGTLAGSKPVAITFFVRGGPPFKGDPALKWKILGTKGELEIINPLLLAADVIDTDAEIRLHDFATDQVTFVDWKVGDEWEETLPVPAQNIARMYEAFANGEAKRLVTLEQAVMRHRMLDEMEKSSEEGRKGNYLKR